MISLTMLVIVLLGGLFTIRHARQSVEEEIRSSVSMALSLIDVGFAYAGNDQRRFTAWVTEIAHLHNTRHLRIHVQQSPETFIKLDAPELEQEEAEFPRWFAWAVTPPLMVGERRMETTDGNSLVVKVEANPNDEIAEAWSEAEDLLYLILTLAVAIYVLVHFTLGKAFKTVGIILNGLSGIERGNYENRLPPFSLPEFDQISKAFNHTAEALAKSRAENRTLTQHSLAIQEEERSYIAQELHDELGQSLSAIKVMAASLRKSVGPDGQEVIQAISEQCDRLFRVVRTMVRRLRPLLLDELGLIPCLEDMFQGWRDRHPDQQLDFDCEVFGLEFPQSVKINLFRIVQECLTNIEKHADARHIDIRLRSTIRRETPWVSLEIIDDGQGFDPTKPFTGIGILGIKERTASLEGEFFMIAAPGEGVTIEVQVPCYEDKIECQRSPSCW
jgi:two-component system sensor histidine kinase UhpB